MLLELKEEERRKTKFLGFIAGLAAAAGLAGILLRTIWLAQPGRTAKPALEGGTVELGKLLFNAQGASPGYLLPFEIVSLILLVAMVGVILLSKKDLK